MRITFRVGRLRFEASLSFVLLCAFMPILWLAGGASRADAPGQVVVRSAAALLLMAALLFGPRPALGEARPVAWLLGASTLLALLQLVPLPPGIWLALPGRAPFAQAATLSGQPQPWRPWTIVPGATVNAATSLIVPIAVLVIAGGLDRAERLRLPSLVLGVIVAAALAGLLQFASIAIDNPLVNGTPGQTNGLFANRNHFALFMACGCVLAPVWAFLGRRPGWRPATALALVLLFALLILGSGSRAGIIVGFLGLVTGLLLVRREIPRILRRHPRWLLPALLVALLAFAAALVVLSGAADRAVSLNRLLTSDVEQDMRSRALPTIMAMIRTYLPMGSGIGGFDPLFRLHEPLALLKPTYFNHAHDDLLEIVLDAGLPGLLLLVAALSWWVLASIRAWRHGDTLSRLGSAILLLVVVASVFDYPARTPMMMAIIILAGIWLASGRGGTEGQLYPR